MGLGWGEEGCLFWANGLVSFEAPFCFCFVLFFWVFWGSGWLVLSFLSLILFIWANGLVGFKLLCVCFLLWAGLFWVVVLDFVFLFGCCCCVCFGVEKQEQEQGNTNCSLHLQQPHLLLLLLLQLLLLLFLRWRRIVLQNMMCMSSSVSSPLHLFLEKLPAFYRAQEH